MSHTPHELHEEFPEFAERMRGLQGNAHYAKLAESYHQVNRAIHRAETHIEPTDDAHLEGMRKERLKLKDEIFAMLKS